MLRFAFLIGVVLLALTGHATAATYYVDQTVGNDQNSGTSPSSPWKNCPGMNAFNGSGSPFPGDTVYFNRSGTWLVIVDNGGCPR